MRNPSGVMAVCIAVLGIAPAVGLQPRAQRQTLRASVELIEVDVIVADAQGRPRRGLTRDDFQIFEDGEPVETVSFEEVDMPEAPPQSAVPSDLPGALLAAMNAHATAASS